jgi:hypothetical protein
MSYPAYYGRPAMVAPRYRRRSAPASVHVVALFQYLGALATLAVAVVVALIARGVAGSLPTDRLPDGVRTGLTGGGLVIAVTLGVLGLCWLLVARKLQRGRQWARVTVLALSVLSIAGTAYDYWSGRRLGILVGLALPLLYVLLLSTRRARSWFRHGDW